MVLLSFYSVMILNTDRQN